MRTSPASLARRVGLTAALLGFSGCAHHVGRGAVAGISQELAQGQTESAETPNQQISRVAAERAVAGAISSLAEPEQQKKLQQVVNELVAQAISTALRTATEVPAAGQNGKAAELGVSPVALLMAQAARTAAGDALHELITGLGGRGEGPLGVSLAATGRELTTSVVAGAVDQLRSSFPECTGPDLASCIDHHIGETSRKAAAGFSTGVRETIGWQLVGLAAVIGLLVGLLGHWLWSLRSHGRGRALRPRTT